MSNIHIVTDSTGYLTKEFASQNNIDIVPLTVFFENNSFPEGMPGEYDEFYSRLKVSKDFPSTSQPSVQAFVNTYEKSIARGEEIIVLTISSKLSGTFNSASVAAQQVAPDKISVIDSLAAGPCLRFLVDRALELASEGKSREEIVEIIHKERENVKALFTVGSLDYLKKGGRLSNAQAFIGTLLNIKPIIALTDGLLLPAGKVRGKNKALEMIIEGIPENVKKISVIQIQNLEEAEEFKKELQGIFKNAVITIDELGPVLGAHLGPMAIGACIVC